MAASMKMQANGKTHPRKFVELVFIWDYYFKVLGGAGHPIHNQVICIFSQYEGGNHMINIVYHICNECPC